MELTRLIEYNGWANQQILARIVKLNQEQFERELGGSFGSLKATLIHVLESDWLWLQRWKGIPLAELPKWDVGTPESINKVWTDIRQEMIEVSRKLESQGNPDIPFITRKGAPYTLPFSEIVVHVSHHGSYHRGQLTNMLRMVGGETVSTDYFLYYVNNKS